MSGVVGNVGVFLWYPEDIEEIARILQAPGILGGWSTDWGNRRREFGK